MTMKDSRLSKWKPSRGVATTALGAASEASASSVTQAQERKQQAKRGKGRGMPVGTLSSKGGS